MAGIRLRLGEADQKVYERGGEWFLFDLAALMDLPSSKLEALEDAMGNYSIRQVRDGWRTESVRSLRASMFIARWVGGVREPWESFDPQTMHMEYEVEPEVDPTGPPAGGSPAS